MRGKMQEKEQSKPFSMNSELCSSNNNKKLILMRRFLFFCLLEDEDGLSNLRFALCLSLYIGGRNKGKRENDIVR